MFGSGEAASGLHPPPPPNSFCSLSDPLSHFPYLDIASIYTYTKKKKKPTPPFLFTPTLLITCTNVMPCSWAWGQLAASPTRCYSGWAVGCALPRGGHALESLQTSCGLVQALTLDVPKCITATSLFQKKKKKRQSFVLCEDEVMPSKNFCDVGNRVGSGIFFS